VFTRDLPSYDEKSFDYGIGCLEIGIEEQYSYPRVYPGAVFLLYSIKF
jgi:hypothetical protein